MASRRRDAHTLACLISVKYVNGDSSRNVFREVRIPAKLEMMKFQDEGNAIHLCLAVYLTWNHRFETPSLAYTIMHNYKANFSFLKKKRLLAISSFDFYGSPNQICKNIFNLGVYLDFIIF